MLKVQSAKFNKSMKKRNLKRYIYRTISSTFCLNKYFCSLDTLRYSIAQAPVE
jgi:hypothetical protein